MMVKKFSFALCFVALCGQVAMAQSKAGNILTGDAKADVVNRYNGPATLAKPDKIAIHDFAFPVGGIAMDESVAARLHRSVMLRRGVDEDSSPEVLAQHVQAAFAKALASELKKTNIQTVSMPGQQSAAKGVKSESDLVVEGQFVAINEGDKSKRIMIGLGRGASNLKTHVTVSTVVEGRPTVVLEFNLSSESGKKPGAVATMGVGSLAVGAATGGVSDRKSTVVADASRMGSLVGKQLEAFMAEQKWISNTSEGKPAVQHE